MKKITLYLFLLAATWFDLRCSCRYADCGSEDYINLRFVSASNGFDLFFGGGYDIDSLRITEENTAGEQFSVKPGVHTAGPAFHEIGLALSLDTRQFFIQFNPSDTDTLIVSIDQKKSKCCGVQADFVEGFYNGIKLDSVVGSDWLVRK